MTCTTRALPLLLVARVAAGASAANLATLQVVIADFAVTHLHVSSQVIAGSFFVGLFWGWLFRHQGTLVGAAVSHVVLGELAYFLVGAPAG